MNVQIQGFQKPSHLHLILTVLYIIQGKIVNKPNRNDDSDRANESVVDFNIEQLEYSSLPGSDLSFTTPNTKQLSSIESVNTPRKPTSDIPETPNLSQKDINRNHNHLMTTYLKKYIFFVSERVKHNER